MAAAAGLDRALDVQAVPVQLHGEAVGEGFAQGGEQARGGVAPALRKQARNGAEGAAGQQEQAGRSSRRVSSRTQGRPDGSD
jgi:hypothetical protein